MITSPIGKAQFHGHLIPKEVFAKVVRAWYTDKFGTDPDEIRQSTYRMWWSTSFYSILWNKHAIQFSFLESTITWRFKENMVECNWLLDFDPNSDSEDDIPVVDLYNLIMILVQNPLLSRGYSSEILNQ